MGKDLHEFTMEHTVDLDDYFTKIVKDSSFRQTYAPEKNKMASALALLEAREEAGLTQAKLAEKSGVPKTTIVRIENGSNTTIETLTKLANALGRPLTLRIDPMSAL
ncbi:MULTISPECIES: helix-turn-helix transcriptional regulator [Lacticaseibacillus]|uniref:Transcriptional regulator n=1 Tax=Lacticaseibacillus casei DSM 20011 = JCM 1134 = ATCC 393 TaxID=1423732 RepID=A0AAD1ESG1_LACCA|nr:helix-turn-helix transcriptional regulator [Lacticaseibacillus casei]MBI6597764.1 helix-turn-helix transcriptional regulator [Lacticaseibacillus casei]MBO1481502.1 helix-turn-helix transcriptional regulator [Lacticaseibacillus casei]MBO2416746.1 helix-turn-helix transcriptional regulator [Lacticaseibacillus casei]MCK2080328.1 helix-turn-helix transcriptional regulator [Lacticaseibacillus casei]MDZ5495782.1 helix-turn-helix transcriptional regulator [Lacticaseibacillus casei]